MQCSRSVANKNIVPLFKRWNVAELVRSSVGRTVLKMSEGNPSSCLADCALWMGCRLCRVGGKIASCASSSDTGMHFSLHRYNSRRLFSYAHATKCMLLARQILMRGDTKWSRKGASLQNHPHVPAECVSVTEVYLLISSLA
jgi:hypothetical protein